MSLPPLACMFIAFANRDWLTPLIQLLTNVMVSSPEPTERSFALATLRLLVSRLVVDDRYVPTVLSRRINL